ncbi:MAG: rod shape-determining protein RodA, partial [Symploca sp. SIO2B6]|nr:rod shape-determining protein RodA [Symploca sp. SIO2B6]
MLQSSSNPVTWKSILQPWQEIDWFLIILVAGLTLAGGLMIRSTGLTDELASLYWQHWILGGIGLGILLMIARWRYENLLRWVWIIYGVTNISLLAVMVIGTEALGAQRWISIAGFNVQPSEFAKLGLIITLAGVLHRSQTMTLFLVFRVLGIMLVPWFLIFLQPDLGTSLVFGVITLGMLYWANANPGWLVLLVAPLISAICFGFNIPLWLLWVVGVGAIAWHSLPWKWLGTFAMVVVNLISGGIGQVFWNLLKDYQKARLILFLDPDKDPLGGGYHLIQSRIAIGAGQLWGRGIHQGTQTQLGFIPEQHTDFIFSAIGEELGFVGAIAVLLAFWCICLRLVIIAQNAKDNFGSLIAIGVLLMIIFQVFVNIGMTIGLAPITGIPLPWLS